MEKIDGKKIRELRVRRGISQEALAFEIGMSQKYVSLWENGKSEPDEDMMRRLRKALGMEER